MCCITKYNDTLYKTYNDIEHKSYNSILNYAQ